MPKKDYVNILIEALSNEEDIIDEHQPDKSIEVGKIKFEKKLSPNVENLNY